MEKGGSKKINMEKINMEKTVLILVLMEKGGSPYI